MSRALVLFFQNARTGNEALVIVHIAADTERDFFVNMICRHVTGDRAADMGLPRQFEELPNVAFRSGSSIRYRSILKQLGVYPLYPNRT